MKTGSLGRSNNSNRFSLILFAISLGFSTCNVTLLYLLYCRWRRFVFFPYSLFFQQLFSPFTTFVITFWITILKLFFTHRLFLLVTNLLPPSNDICLNYELFYYYNRGDLNVIIFCGLSTSGTERTRQTKLLLPEFTATFELLMVKNSFEVQDAKIVHFDGLIPLYGNSEDGNCANVLLFSNGDRILVDVVEDGKLRDEPWEILICWLSWLLGGNPIGC